MVADKLANSMPIQRLRGRLAQDYTAILEARRRATAGFARRHLHPSLTIEHGFAIDRADASEPRAEFTRQQFGHFNNHLDSIADLDRRAEIQGL
jgi:hypothetical protein